MNSKKVIAQIRKKYKTKLAEAVIAGALEEVDMFDGRGNMVLTPDLKVKHSASGYEYTVDHVEGEGDEAVVFLRHPEEPRLATPDVEAPLTEKTKINIKNLDVPNISAGGTELEIPEKISLEKPSDAAEKVPPSLVSVPKKEFESDYEVE